MPHYMVGGRENYRELHRVPVQEKHGVDLPAQLYQRWKDARAELDAVQRTIVAYMSEHADRDAIPQQLRDQRDRPSCTGRSAPATDS